VADDITRQSVLFPGLFEKPVVAVFDQRAGSSDGGALLLKAADEGLRLTAALSESLGDERQAGKVRHGLEELLRQRVFGLACGYADGNDAARLSDDPIQKLLVGRDPVSGEALASQPTLSRFENAVGPRALYRLGRVLAERVIERHRRRRKGRARRITIDLDVTDDPTHGAQQLSFFNGHYDSWCYLPMLGFLTFEDEAEQYLFAAMLRPGNAPTKKGALGILRRVLPLLRGAFPEAALRVRLDGGYACPELFDFLDNQGLEYVVAMHGNAVLKRRAERLMRKARARSRMSGRTEHVYGDTGYAARSWSCKRRVIIKAEVVRHPGRLPKDNARFVVTNTPQTARWIYERIYCGRGEIENRLKELHHGLEMDRTSCSSFWANQFRVLLTAAAYVLMQELRLQAIGTSCARAQVSTLRERLIKLGAHVVVSVRRIVVHLPASYPFLDVWKRLALRLDPQPV
jgi:hypothetical protein